MIACQADLAQQRSLAEFRQGQQSGLATRRDADVPTRACSVATDERLLATRMRVRLWFGLILGAGVRFRPEILFRFE